VTLSAEEKVRVYGTSAETAQVWGRAGRIAKQVEGWVKENRSRPRE
jgi:hypothetical protein